MPFAFEKLDVYQKSLNWVENIEALSIQLKGKISFSTLDQLSRASLSIPLNIAEGNGRWTKGDKRNFFYIARGSVFECAAIIQILKRRSLINEMGYKTSYDDLERMAKMLTKLIQSTDLLQS
ncbi:MAG: four helix bundle protein [Bacteriovoracaceae bacterium]|nr:four helix bundle protein [Bacteriovoracaceae bacterium]